MRIAFSFSVLMLVLSFESTPALAQTSGDRIVALLKQTPLYGEATLRACVFEYMSQGLSLKQIMELCEARLQAVADSGGDANSVGGALIGIRPEAYDPGAVTAACGVGDTKIGQTAGPSTFGGQLDGSKWGTDLAFGQDSMYDHLNEQGAAGLARELYGTYSWGGNQGQEVSGPDGQKFEIQGLTQREAEMKKVEAINKAQEVRKAYQDTVAGAKGKPGAKEVKLDDVKKAEEAAKADPNLKPKPDKKEPPKEQPKPAPPPAPAVTKTGPGSVCSDVVTSARELLRECNRTKWQLSACQKLQARMGNCPDPTYILVDPDAGYTCAAMPDPKAVQEAWVEECRKTTRPGPDGRDPCAPPNVTEYGQPTDPNSEDVCTNPQAYVDPSEGVCIGPLVVGGPGGLGRTELDKLLLFALTKFGGPIFVLPPPKPPHGGGGDPRPGPKPG